MSSLCSAYFGKPKFRISSKESRKQRSQPKRDALYGFLPDDGSARTEDGTEQVGSAQSSPERADSGFGSCATSLHDSHTMENSPPNRRSRHQSNASTTPSNHSKRWTQPRDSGYFSQRRSRSCRPGPSSAIESTTIGSMNDDLSTEQSVTKYPIEIDVKIMESPVNTTPDALPSDLLPKRYPKTRDEVSNILENANKYHPANIPMLVVSAYIPPGGRQMREETEVEVGMVVNALYKTRLWVFVRTPLEDAGFVPFSCVEHIGAKKQARDFSQQFPEDAVLRDVPRPPQREGPPLEASYGTNNGADDSAISQSSNGSYFLPGLAGDAVTHAPSSSALNCSFLDTRGSRTSLQLGANKRSSLAVPPRTNLAISRSHIRASLPSIPHKPNHKSASTSDLHRVPLRSSLMSYKSKPVRKDTKLIVDTNNNSPATSDYNAQDLRKQCNKLYGSDIFDNDPVGYCSSTADLLEDNIADYSRYSTSSTSLHLSELSDGLTLSRDSLCDIVDFDMPVTLAVLFDFEGDDENDVAVRQHDVVTLLSGEDPDWLWVRRQDGIEGFIPRAYAADLQALCLDPSVKSTYL